MGSSLNLYELAARHPILVEIGAVAAFIRPVSCI